MKECSKSIARRLADSNWHEPGGSCQLVLELGEAAELVRLEQLSSTYRFDLPRYDQTLTPVGECGIEFVIRKRTAQEMADHGRWRRTTTQPDAEIRRHLNQYREDLQALKRSNVNTPPFSNEDPV